MEVPVCCDIRSYHRCTCCHTKHRAGLRCMLDCGTRLAFSNYAIIFCCCAALSITFIMMFIMTINRRYHSTLPYWQQGHIECTEKEMIKLLHRPRNKSSNYRTSFPPNYRNSTSRYRTRYKVPNIIHYIWFQKHIVECHTAMSLYRIIGPISAYENQKPDKIILHTNCKKFDSFWWQELFRLVPMEVRYLKCPSQVYGQSITMVQHAADVNRLSILAQQGGIYLDFDVVTFRSLDPLRAHPCTIGTEAGDKITKNKVNAGVILAEPNATFIRRWHEGYKDYRPKEWIFNSGEVPTELTKAYSDFVHVDKNIWHDASGRIYREYLNLSETYTYHLWLHLWQRYDEGIGKSVSVCDALKMNNSFGDAAKKFYTDQHLHPSGL